MIFDKVNIKTELLKLKQESSILKDINSQLEASAKNDEAILDALKNSENNPYENIHLSEEEKDIFSFKQIEKICINYRLRFLDTKYFKHEFPYEAITKIKDFEKKYNTNIKSFKIVAPDKAFDLQECNQDPLLFVPIGNDKFYLLHQWGNDLAWYRKFLYFPIRNVYTYFYFILAVAGIFAFTVPFEWFQVKPDNILYMRMWFTIHCFIGLFFIIIFLGSIMQTSFSSMNWKSKFMNE